MKPYLKNIIGTYNSQAMTDGSFYSNLQLADPELPFLFSNDYRLISDYVLTTIQQFQLMTQLFPSAQRDSNVKLLGLIVGEGSILSFLPYMDFVDDIIIIDIDPAISKFLNAQISIILQTQGLLISGVMQWETVKKTVIEKITDVIMQQYTKYARGFINDLHRSIVQPWHFLASEINFRACAQILEKKDIAYLNFNVFKPDQTQLFVNAIKQTEQQFQCKIQSSYLNLTNVECTFAPSPSQKETNFNPINHINFLPHTTPTLVVRVNVFNFLCGLRHANLCSGS